MIRWISVFAACVTVAPAMAADDAAPADELSAAEFDEEFLEFLLLEAEDGWTEFFNDMPPNGAGDILVPRMAEKHDDEQD